MPALSGKAVDLVDEQATGRNTNISAAERNRAARFRKDADRDIFVIGRAYLRLLLSRHLGENPDRIILANGSHGRPMVEQREPISDLDFNISHSGELVAITLCSGGRVGIDIEQTSAFLSVNREIRSAWSPAERRQLDLMSSGTGIYQRAALWTRKEAILKGDGRGLSFPMDQIELDYSIGQPVPVHYENPNLSPSTWTLWDLMPCPNTCGTAF